MPSPIDSSTDNPEQGKWGILSGECIYPPMADKIHAQPAFALLGAN